MVKAIDEREVLERKVIEVIEESSTENDLFDRTFILGVLDNGLFIARFYNSQNTDEKTVYFIGSSISEIHNRFSEELNPDNEFGYAFGWVR